MNQLEALKKIEGLGVSGFETRDVSALLQVTPANASVILTRLAKSDRVHRLARGHWSTVSGGKREQLAEQLAAPYPAYISLHSALFTHGLIEQIPAVLYVVTMGRARRIETPLGSVSLHRMPPELFGGFALDEHGIKMATAEKALFDLVYLSPSRNRLFAALPEITYPADFRWPEVRRWARAIQGKSRRVFVEAKIAQLSGGKGQRLSKR